MQSVSIKVLNCLLHDGVSRIEYILPTVAEVEVVVIVLVAVVVEVVVVVVGIAPKLFAQLI